MPALKRMLGYFHRTRKASSETAERHSLEAFERSIEIVHVSSMWIVNELVVRVVGAAMC